MHSSPLYQPSGAGIRSAGKTGPDNSLHRIRKLVPLLALLLFSALPLHCQLKTTLTLDGGPAWDIYTADDPVGTFDDAVIYGTAGNVALWQEVMPGLSVGTGVSIHQYHGGLNLQDNRPHQSVQQQYNTWSVPLRIAYTWQHPALVVSFTPQLGYHYGRMAGNAWLPRTASLLSDKAGNVVEYDMQQEVVRQDLHLLETGVSVNYRMNANWQVSLRVGYLRGLRDVTAATVDYLSAGTPLTATCRSDGSRWESAFSLHIPVSNLWENRDVRKHRRIEHSTEQRSFKREIRTLYFGGDIGALWRSFSTTNPAVGARPIDGKGVFRYANMHTGGYAGLMIGNALGVDVGAYYQRSATYVSLMYDHEADAGERAAAPGFLEVPLMFRYYIDLYRSMVAVYPTLGASMLTHFIVADSASAGGGSFDYNTTGGPVGGTFEYSASRPVRFGYTVKAGVGLEYRVPISLPLAVTASVTYSHGFRTIGQTSVTTSLDEYPPISTVSYRGNGWKAAVGFRIPILLGRENRRCGAL